MQSALISAFLAYFESNPIKVSFTIYPTTRDAEVVLGHKHLAKYFQSYSFLTLQAKALLSKSKLMPKVSYFGSVLPMPNCFQEKINNSLLKFVVPHKKTFLKVENLAAGKHLGGIGLANVILHCNVMLIRNVMFYLKAKVEGMELCDDLEPRSSHDDDLNLMILPRIQYWTSSIFFMGSIC